MIGLCDEMSQMSRTKIMASCDKPSKGYFSFLNVISSADANFFFESQREERRMEVEDLVTGMSRGSWKDGKEVEW